MIDYWIFYVLKDFLYICLWVHADTSPSKPNNRETNTTILTDCGLANSDYFCYFLSLNGNKLLAREGKRQDWNVIPKPLNIPDFAKI